MPQMLWAQATITRAHSIATPSTCCGATHRTTVAAIVRTNVTRKKIRLNNAERSVIIRSHPMFEAWKVHGFPTR